MCNMLQYEKAISLYHSRGVANSTKIALMHQQIIRTNKMICFFLGHNIVGTHSVITSCTINEVIE